MVANKPEVTEFRIYLENISSILFDQLCSNKTKIANLGPLREGRDVGKYRWVNILPGVNSPILYTVDDYREGDSYQNHRDHIYTRLFKHEELLNL